LPFSLHWVPMKTPAVSLDQAHAQFVGQQSSAARNVAGVSRPVQRRAYRRVVDRRPGDRRAAGRRITVGAAAVGTATTRGAAAAGVYVAGFPPYYGPGYGYEDAYGEVGMPAAYGPYGYEGPGYGYVVEPAGYGRWCAVYPSGFRWCWTQT
jgi:hypothetical protein